MIALDDITKISGAQPTRKDKKGAIDAGVCQSIVVKCFKWKRYDHKRQNFTTEGRAKFELITRDHFGDVQAKYN